MFRSRGRAVLPDHAQWLIAGLGNPGPRYAATRHNVGFLALDEMALDFCGVPGVKAEVASLGEAVVVKPTTFMNASGEAVADLAQRYAIPPERVVVVHDELDLPAGKVRLKKGGNENGHNGLKSISEKLGTRDYVRVRIGISRPPAGTAVSDWVLGPIEEDLDRALDLAARGAHLVVTEGLTIAQNKIHSRGK